MIPRSSICHLPASYGKFLPSVCAVQDSVEPDDDGTDLTRSFGHFIIAIAVKGNNFLQAIIKNLWEKLLCGMEFVFLISKEVK